MTVSVQGLALFDDTKSVIQAALNGVRLENLKNKAQVIRVPED